MRKLFLLLLTLECFCQAKAQVNYQTGSAIYNLPIFSWQDDKSRLNTNISINYNSGNGLKVDEVASNIGQGWNLAAGGVITRIQNGLPDDQKERTGAIEDVDKYPAGYLYNTALPTDGCPTELVRYPIFKDKNHVYKQHNAVAADLEQDYFAFQFNGRHGMFVLEKGRSDRGILLGDSKLRVTFTRDESMLSSGVRTTINTFAIQDENGSIYKFEKLEYTKILKTNYCDNNLNVQYNQPTFEANHVYHEMAFDNTGIAADKIVNGWHLTEVEDALTHRKIIYSYIVRDITNNSGISLNVYQPKDYSVVSHSLSISQTPVLSSISYPDGHSITFNFGAERFDLVGDYSLASIDINYDSRFVSKYILATTYFISTRYGTPTTESQKKLARLCLQSIKKVGIDLKYEEPPFVFDYNTGSATADDIIPPPFTPNKDIWGFYNGTNSTDFNNIPVSVSLESNQLTHSQVKGLCYLRNGVTGPVLNAKNAYAKNGLLKTVTYPTGGTLRYDYEQNTAKIGGVLKTVGGVHVNKTVTTDGTNCSTGGLEINYKYTTDEVTNDPSMWGIEQPVNSLVTQSHYSPEKKRLKYKFPFRLLCEYKYLYPGIQARELSIALTAEQKTLNTLSVILDVVSSVFTTIDIITICLAATATPAAILAILIDLASVIAGIILTCFRATPSQDDTNTIYFNSDINQGNPLPVQYKRVVITESSGGNGKTIMEFTNPADYALWEPTNPIFSNKQRYAPWAYGLVKKATTYNSGGVPIKQIENVYDFTMARNTNAEIYTTRTGWSSAAIDQSSCKCFVAKTSSQRSDDWSNLQLNTSNFIKTLSASPDLKADIYKIYTGRVELRESFERIFKAGSSTEFLENSTSFTYNNSYQPATISTVQSSGDGVRKSNLYPLDLSTTTMVALQRANVLNIVVQTSTSLKKVGSVGAPLIIGESRDDFKVLANGDIKVSYSGKNLFNRPMSSTDIASGYAGGKKSGFGYTNDGVLIAVKTDQNEGTCYIYDYNDKFPVATITNSQEFIVGGSGQQLNSFYTSFETSTLGGWVFSGSGGPTYVTNTGITGNRAMTLSAGKKLISGSVDGGQPYRLSFWALSNASVSVQYNTTTLNLSTYLVKSAPTINGFTYYEYILPLNVLAASDPANITFMANTTVDELRLYPARARMVTSTYDPLYGKTSDCDENNFLTYYEYENGRLRFIKDDKKNIIKMYEYNTASKSKSFPCTGTVPPPVVYGNNAISETFTKNCGACGHKCTSQGSQVVYSIPANTYTSTISQAAADAIAQNDLDNNGQAYANTNGTCSTLYWNVDMSQTFTKEGCNTGYVGSSVIYTVPANTYSSTVSQTTANNLAQIDIDANGQAYANFPGNGSCIPDNSADFIGSGEVQCISGNEHIRVVDINPSSSTFLQTQLLDNGPYAGCVATSSCSFSYNTSLFNTTASYNAVVSASGAGTFTFIIRPVSNTTDWSVNQLLGTISGGCIPSATRTFNITDNDTMWTLTINTSGQVYIKKVSGPAILNTSYIEIIAETYAL